MVADYKLGDTRQKLNTTNITNHRKNDPKILKRYRGCAMEFQFDFMELHPDRKNGKRATDPVTSSLMCKDYLTIFLVYFMN